MRNLRIELIHLSSKCAGEKKKSEAEEEEKIIPFRQNLLGSIWPFPEPVQLLVLGASLSYGKPRKRGRINQMRDSRIEMDKSDFVFDHQPDAFCSG